MPDGPNDTSDNVAAKVAEAVAKITHEFDADILSYSGNLFEPHDSMVIRCCRERPNKRRNVLLILITPGGSAEGAYRVARCLQRAYRTYDVEPKDGHSQYTCIRTVRAPVRFWL